MVSSNLKHVGMVSHIVYIINFCVTNIVLLLIIEKYTTAMSDLKIQFFYSFHLLISACSQFYRLSLVVHLVDFLRDYY